MRVSIWTRFVQAEPQLFFSPGEYFARLLADIDAAETEIILETYIFKLDQIGNQVLEALQNAAARGVGLRLLIDGVGSWRDGAEIAARLDIPNCELRVFHPLPWDFPLYRNALQAGHWYSQVLRLVASINHRDHRKLCIIDQCIAWLGSFNVTADHFNHQPGIYDDYWHDTGLRATGSLVKILNANFDQVWQRKRGNFGERSRSFLASESISRRKLGRMQLLQVLSHARRRIWITNAYFNPSHRVLRLLKQKAKTGVSVKLIVPQRSDVIFFPLLSRSFYADLLQSGIRVFEYGNRIVHSKTMLIDDHALVGSTNLNYRSLLHDLELDLLLEDVGIVQRLTERFDNDIENSTEITLRHPGLHRWLLKPLGWLARFLRYWL